MYDVIENEGGGTTVRLTEGDSLDEVPEPHRRLITESIRDAYRDPRKYFAERAARAPVPAMKQWLNVLLDEKDWQLNLHQGDPKEWTAAGYCWWSDSVRSAEIAPPCHDRRKMPLTILDDYFSIVDSVRWMPFGCAGGLQGCEQHTPLTNYSYQYRGAAIDPARTFAIGWSPCGDMMIYTEQDQGGWLCHENGKVHLLGSVADLLEWAYSELFADRSPEFDYKWA